MRTVPPIAVILVLAFAIPAHAQSAASRKPSLNLGAGVVGSSSLDTFPGAVGLVSIGTDIPLTSRWSIRIETGQRIPRHSRSVTKMLVFFDGVIPREPGDVISADRITEVDETVLGDVSVLLRLNSPPGDSRYEVAFLGGLELKWTHTERMTAMPRSPADLDDIEVVHDEARRVWPMPAVGMEAGRTIGERWTVLLRGIVSGQSPFTNDFRMQPRAGVILKRRF